MMLKKMLMAATSDGGYQQNAVKFDGANDYLTRGADLTGIADSKTGILSFWIRKDYVGDCRILNGKDGYTDVEIVSGRPRITCYNSVGTGILLIQTTSQPFLSAPARWFHVLMSWDLASTTTHVYLSDQSDKTEVIVTNDTIDFTRASPNWAVAALISGSSKFQGGLAELYFAPGQYLDFSSSANRRKFIDASGLPVSLGSDGSTPTGTAPLIYLMGNSSAFGVNSGTGGNFTVNGTLEKASTTPSTLPVYNAVKFDGSSDYLTRGADLTGISDSKSGILSCWLRRDGGDGTLQRIFANLAGTLRFHLTKDASNKYVITGINSAGSTILTLTSNTAYTASPKWIHLLASWDLAATAGTLYIDSASDLAAGSTKTNDTIDYVTATPNWAIGADTDGTDKMTGAVAEFYFAPGQYLDFATQANREKFILNGAPVSLGSDGSTPTGAAPAIYLPNRAALVGTNAGSGGNFTINGAPKDANSTPVYYYAEPSTFDGTNDYLALGADLTGIADGKAGTVSFWIRLDGADTTLQRIFANLVGTLRFHVSRNASNKFAITGINSAGSTILLLTSSTSYIAGPVWVHVLASWDLAAATGYMYVSNTSDLAGGSTLTNDTIDYVTATPNWSVGANTDGTNKTFATIGDFWFNNTYLDISQSSNRAKFIDQTTLRPVALGAKGELPTGSQPLLYLGRDFSNFQTNLGSGGNFTVTGALTRGTTSPSDVKA